MREAIQEALNEMDDDNTPYLKYLALIGSGVFFIYFLFLLPGPSINPELINDYHWINQCLIEFKITLKDAILYYLGNSGNPGNPDNPGSNTTTPITPNTELNRYFPISPSNSESSGGMSTVTPNTPRVSTLSSLAKSEVGTQTIINAITVGKMVETVKN